MSAVTTETTTKLRRLHIDLSPWLIGNPEDNAPCTRGELRTILDALPALLDAAEEQAAATCEPAGGGTVSLPHCPRDNCTATGQLRDLFEESA